MYENNANNLESSYAGFMTTQQEFGKGTNPEFYLKLEMQITKVRKTDFLIVLMTSRI